MSVVTKVPPKWPVVEIFGPTVQGEGVDQGVGAHFVRFGGCDFRCTWCDTPHAVLPEEVRKNATKMDTEDILDKLSQLSEPVKPPWIILTGGNPGLHDLSTLVQALQKEGYLVAVETQGSRWREWMADVDRLCVSPKPPSSLQEYDWTQVQRFLVESMEQKAAGEREYEWVFLKVVVFTDEDLNWAVKVRRQFSDCLLYLSAGNDAGRTVGQPEREDTRKLAGVRRDLLDKARWLTERVLETPELCTKDVVVQSQFHVALWGNELGR